MVVFLGFITLIYPRFRKDSINKDAPLLSKNVFRHSEDVFRHLDEVLRRSEDVLRHRKTSSELMQ